MPVVSMSKKEFGRLEVLLGVQSGRLRVADACELLSLKRRQVFLLAGLKHGGAAGLAITVCLRRIVIWRCRWCANDMLILARHWRRRS